MEIIKKKILKFLAKGPRALMEIFEYLDNKATIREIRIKLMELEDEKILEERHFGKAENFRVDYFLEKK